MARKPSDTVKLNLRFTEELRRKLERAAEKNNQSMNLEIVARLEDSFRKEEVRDIMREQFATFMQFLEAHNVFSAEQASQGRAWDTDAYRLMFEDFMSKLDARYVVKDVQ